MRLRIIDFLRAIAILMVMAYHCPPLKKYFHWGWAGVDLFFVLSGFLVSGLIFQELRKRKKFSPLNFLIRRAFKIYPSFYLYLLVMIIIQYLNEFILNNPSKLFPSNILAELLFFQNYSNGFLYQSWSLAIEEHFYIFLTLLIFLAIKFNCISYRPVVITYLLLFVTALYFRHQQYDTPFNYYQSFYPTHLRMDALFFGVLISFFYHFHQNELLRVINKFKLPLTILSIISIFPIFFFDVGDKILTIYGLPLLYLGFGILLITNPEIDRIISRIISKYAYQIISTIGVYSYSIYLWHLGIPQIFVMLVQKQIPNLNNSMVTILIYFTLSFSIGIITGKFIEIPFLKIRDKYFPKPIQTSI